MLFDLPAVAARAEARFAAAGLGARAVGGDFARDALPTGADIATLVRVIHDHDDVTVRRILAAARAALPAGGTLLLAEPMAATRGAEATGTESGRPRRISARGRLRPGARGADAHAAADRPAGRDSHVTWRSVNRH
jgi:demethylspheroidene O-methyltransferase